MALVLLLGAHSACALELDPPPARTAEAFLRGRELVDLERLEKLRREADVEPAALGPQWRAGAAHVRASLHGHLEQRDAAERYLERAWRLDPRGEKVPAARMLARFLNMRSSVMDLSKVELQLELYASLAEADPEHEAAGTEQFHFRSFAQAAETLRRYGEGETLAALRELGSLERAMEARITAHPDEIDSHTMAGNFELTFAGVIPLGIERRLRRGIDHLDVQQARWDELPARARNTELAPNVRTVFALFLAEALLAAGDAPAAAEHYSELIAFEQVPDTRVRAQLVEVAEHRLATLELYAGDRELLPPWPAGVSGCVACHASQAELPVDDLHLLAPLERRGAQP